MKLATFTEKGKTRIGIIGEGGILDLSQSAPELPTNMRSFLQAGDNAMNAARAAAEKGGSMLPLESVHLEAPVTNPGKMLAIGLNYADHVKETGLETPKYQIWFNKQHNCVNGPYDEIWMPSVSSELDYEAELCFVIGKRCKHVPRERAHEVIAGYCCGNDLSVRDWQFRAQTFQIGKSFDTHGPIGPWIVTPDELGDPHVLDIRGLVNGEERQKSNTCNLIFDCYDQIAHLTQSFPLDPGDIIFTGTPGGVGFVMKPTGYLKIGDVVRIEIEKLGYIENRVGKEPVETVIGG